MGMRLGAKGWLKEKWTVFWEDSALKKGEAQQDTQRAGGGSHSY